MALFPVSHPPWLRLVGVRTPYIYFLIFPGHLEFWTPLQIPSWGPPLGCPLLQPEPRLEYFRHPQSPVLFAASLHSVPALDNPRSDLSPGFRVF